MLWRVTVCFALSLGLMTGCDVSLVVAEGPGAVDGSGDTNVTNGDANPANGDAGTGGGDATVQDGPGMDTDASVESGAATDSGGSEAGPSEAGPSEGGPSEAGASDAASEAGILGAGGPPSCLGLAQTCGPAHNEDCCASSVVPGGTFNRNNNATYPATVGDFRLDRFEVTVGRFRKFYQQYPADMPAGSSGIDTNNPTDQGWNPKWNGTNYLPQTASSLNMLVSQCPTAGIWIDWNLTDDNLPINCIDWLEAYAFCIWDGGRLPTDVEWNYAAAGGSDQRPYPWSTGPMDMTIDSSYAVYAPAAAVYAEVGSDSPKGDGRWGHADLAGNVMEWVEDWKMPYPATCNNCASADWSVENYIWPSGPYRQVRGGSAGDDYTFQYTSNPWFWQAETFRIDNIGVRCARNP
jgi:formylglycine-generating enzyme required for sulfatase activity